MGRGGNDFQNKEFRDQPKAFWAYVRTLSQHLEYTIRGRGQIRVPAIKEMHTGLTELGLDPERIGTTDRPSKLGRELFGYFEYRAEVLNSFVESHLMNADRACALYEELKSKRSYDCPLPMNKQSGDKAKPTYFTGIINMLIANGVKGAECNYEPN
jgi:hypothetical protein